MVHHAPTKPPRRPLARALLVAAGAVALLAASQVVSGGGGASTALSLTAPAQQDADQRRLLEPPAYVASPWEEEWAAVATPKAAKTPGELCRLVAAQLGRVQAWLHGIRSLPAVLAAGVSYDEAEGALEDGDISGGGGEDGSGSADVSTGGEQEEEDENAFVFEPVDEEDERSEQQQEEEGGRRRLHAADTGGKAASGKAGGDEGSGGEGSGDGGGAAASKSSSAAAAAGAAGAAAAGEGEGQAASAAGGKEGTADEAPVGDVFSRYVWEDPHVPGATFSAPIEPLVGHFRHPQGPQCVKNSSVHIESRDYMLLLGLTPSRFRQLYPGRALLMDFGTSFFPTSLGWFVKKYGELGVVFDELWAFEAKELKPELYWKQVPAEIKPLLHFYNVGIDSDVHSPHSPIAWIKRYVQPGDFLAIKLDIDNAGIELPFMRAIAEDESLRRLVGELFFEMHYTHKDMPWFGTSGGNTTYSDVLDFFAGLRRTGLRVHYWP